MPDIVHGTAKLAKAFKLIPRTSGLSKGSLPETLFEEEFFESFSIPRNQEMIQIFKDLDLVEHLSPSIPRILETGISFRIRIKIFLEPMPPNPIS